MRLPPPFLPRPGWVRFGMPTLTMDAFYTRLKRNGPEPAYYFHGSEDVLKDEAIRYLIDASLDDTVRDFNLDLVDAGKLDPAGLMDLCSTLPMMADRRVVVVRGVEAWKRKTRAKKAAAAYLADPSPDTVLMLVQSAGEDKTDATLKSAAITVEFGEMEPHKITRWLNREAETNGISFADGALEHLQAAVGTDLGILRAEMGKLAGLADGPVTAEQVADLVGVHRGETVDDWCHAVLDDRTGQAVSLIESVLHQRGVNGVRMVMALGRRLTGIGIARAHYDDGTRGRALERAVFQSIKIVRPFGFSWNTEAANWARWAPNWPMGRLKVAVESARRADEVLKDTRLSKDIGVLTDLVTQLALAGEVSV